MMVPIQIASQRSGVSAHVIRIWERRYQALVPNRTGTNRRMYSDEEIKRLSLLRDLTERGHRIGALAHLPTEKLGELLQADESAARAQTSFSVDAGPSLNSASDYVRICLEAAQKFDADRLRRLLQRARLQFGQRGMLRQVIAPLIAQMGLSWQEGEIRPSHEHLGTCVIREILQTPVPGSQTATSAPELIVATPSGETHELGALLVASSARDLGWRVTYLGAGLPAEEIAHCCRERQARAVAISLVYPESCPTILGQLTHLRQLLPDSIAMIAGGRAAPSYQRQLSDLHIEWAHDLAGLDRMLVSLDP